MPMSCWGIPTKIELGALPSILVGKLHAVDSNRVNHAPSAKQSRRMCPRSVDTRMQSRRTSVSSLILPRSRDKKMGPK
eukprot:4448539-Ditylum_brightwellii.AAC.1